MKIAQTQSVWTRLALAIATVAVVSPAVSLAQAPGKSIRVAVYDHSDGKSSGWKSLQKILVPDTGFEATMVTPQDIRDGVLKDYDVLIMPGGSGSKQSEMLEEKGRENVKQYVESGGSYVGICAGSYLASSHYPWSLGILNAKVWDRSHWNRGTGDVELAFSSSGSDVLKTNQGEVDCYYGQGPLLVPDNNPELPGYEVLATYKTEIAKKGAPTGAMVGTHAIVRTKYGKGRVICFSPHPEKDGGPNSLMIEGVRWAGSAPK
ncbi:BPL-N domain-containing protein [Blastopirellula marina]|uniref:Biofilm PGA synthesis protein PgaC n=1 Tax=Blastopirellula marina TaxID=124 RepID=A0A2S8GCC6_9BACT|nr:BPL-N domain-containing protein [Blastopirellula marina]PQO41911.1 biofilm PGA synthesis protein PgaC [Blastopirellula marina]PTL46269.1 biofilm PGA synthesis protein PgaC [Blastopirellula marina]